MTTRLLLGALVAFTVATAIEGYFLLGIIQRLRTTFEQLLGAAQQLLDAVPGKSAERTTAPDDVRPRIWYRALSRFADAVEHVVGDAELARWEDDGGTTDDNAQTVETPVAVPPTEPMARIDIAGGLPTARPTPSRPLDEVDRQLTRFTFTEGHRR